MEERERVEKLLQDLLYYASIIQGMLDTMDKDTAIETEECLSNSLRELSVLSYL